MYFEIEIGPQRKKGLVFYTLQAMWFLRIRGYQKISKKKKMCRK